VLLLAVRTLADRWFLFVLVGLIMFTIPGWAATAEVSGELGYDLHYLTEAQSFGNSQLRYSLSLDGEVGLATVCRLSFKGGAGYRPVSRTWWEPDEAYADAYLSQVDIRVGRQVINWGTADGLNPTSDINPRDYGSLSALQLKGKPVPAVMAAYYLPGGAGITGVCVLDFVPGDLPSELKLPPASGGPAGNGDQLEFAVRGELPVGGWPVYVTYFNGWDDLPAAWLTFADPLAPPPVPRTQYRRVQSAGVATAFDFRGASLWFEGAYKVPDHLDELDAPMSLAMSSNDPYMQCVVGADYSFDNGLYASAQVVYHQGGSLLVPYFDPMVGGEAQTYVVARGQYSPRDKHDLELVALFNATDSGALLLPQYTYELAEATKLTLGAVWVTGSEKSELADLKEAAQGVLAGLTVSF
jgi:hypothetical protein